MQIDLLRKWHFLITDSSLYHILESKNFRFPFSYDKKPNLRSEMWKIELQNIVVNLLDKRRKLYMNGTVIETVAPNDFFLSVNYLFGEADIA